MRWFRSRVDKTRPSSVPSNADNRIRTMTAPPPKKLQVNTDPHSPGKFRTNGPLANMAEFAAAFACEAGDPMVQVAELSADIW